MKISQRKYAVGQKCGAFILQGTCDKLETIKAPVRSCPGEDLTRGRGVAGYGKNSDHEDYGARCRKACEGG